MPAGTFNDVPDFGELLPEGFYHVRVEKVEDKESKESGNMQTQLWLKVQNEPFVGRVIPDFASHQPQALFKMKAYFKAAGLMDRVAQAGSWESEWLVGTEFYVQITHDTYKGEKRMKVPPFGIKALTEQVALVNHA